MSRAVEIASEAGTKQPVSFGAHGRLLFGFYHPPAAGAARGAAVLLASPIGTDLTRSDRTFRHLAERLARAGFPCLRFDPFGTGDSGGDERSPGLVAAWIEDVGVAADELRARSGVETLAIVGLRIGATLAALSAADRGDVDALVLFSPCVSGAAYVTEVTRLHRLYARIEPSIAGAPPAAAEGQEALGMLLPAALAADLSALDLLKTPRRPAPRALVIDPGNLAKRDELVAALGALGTATEVRAHPGHKFLLTASRRSVVPDEILESIVSWLGDAYPERAAGDPAPAERVATEATPGASGEIPTVLRAGGEPLFGIFTPADPATAVASAPAILVANAGCVNRSGPHRMATRWARRWAALGLDVLRVDLSGIGDSPATPGEPENLTYPAGGLDELQAAMASLEGRRWIVVGLCSGGDYAFQLGELPGAPLDGACILNPRTFCVLDLEAVESPDAPRSPSAPPGSSETDAREVPRRLRAMAERGVDTLLVVSPDDPGTAYVDARAGDAMRALAGIPRFRRVDLPNADHTFTPVSAQEALADLLTDHLLGLAKPRDRMSAPTPASRPRNAR